MNMLRKNGGFTLVELIVVIAILAILASVAVPAYSGYIEKANKSADDTQISVLNTAIQCACALNDSTADDATITLTEDNKNVSKVEIGSKDITGDFTTLYSGNTLNLKYYDTLTVGENGVISGTPKAG